MDKSKVKLIVFDMDGVILDSEPLHENARQMLYERCGIIPDETFPDPVGKSSCDFWKTILQRFQVQGDPQEFEDEQFRLVAKQIEENQIPPSEGLIDVLKWARGKGIEVGLASSSAKQLVDETLRLLKIKQYFDYIVSGSEVENKKPAPDIYEKVLNMSGISANQAYAVEDSSTGIEAAKRAGIFCFAYQNETSGEQDTSMADAKINHLLKLSM